MFGATAQRFNGREDIDRTYKRLENLIEASQVHRQQHSQTFPSPVVFAVIEGEQPGNNCIVGAVRARMVGR